jgi:hypothetical protein
MEPISAVKYPALTPDEERLSVSLQVCLSPSLFLSPYLALALALALVHCLCLSLFVYISHHFTWKSENSLKSLISPPSISLLSRALSLSLSLSLSLCSCLNPKTET